MVLDIWKPFTYFLEKRVVDRIIPNVTSTPGRKLLQDYLLEEDATLHFDHSKWNAVLQRHVSLQDKLATVTRVHVVDYEHLAQDEDFWAYIDQLKQADDPDQLPPAEQLAFWMNAYNALCIHLLVQAQKKQPDTPIRSINNLSIAGGKAVWDQVAGQVNGTDITLNEIEHFKIRQAWAEPRIHACIVCASASCPNLRMGAFDARALDTQMDEQMNDWLSNPSKGALYEQQQAGGIFGGSQFRVTASRIFLWFQKDFGNTKGVRKVLAKYAATPTKTDPQDTAAATTTKNEPMAAAIGKGKAALRYFDYDWSINRKGDA